MTADDSKAPADGLDEQIVRQVEYYFGDINLPRDKFLQEEMKKEDGWIELETMLKFNRLAKLTEDKKVIADALKNSELIEVNEAADKIRRSPEVPLPENTLEYWQEIKRRTAYVKGFDVETTLDEIEKFVKPHGDVQNVLMRRLKKEKTFKGSVFVTFADKETAQKFVADENSSTFNGKPLTKMMQEDYWTKKSKETKEKREEQKKAKQTKRLELLAEQEKNVMATKFVKGVVLEVSGFDPEETKYEDIKSFFKEFGPVAFVAYETGDKTARIRFGTDKEDAAKTAWEKALKKGDGKVLFKEHELTGKVLEGDEEEKYWTEFTKSKIARNDRSQKGGQRGGKGGKNRGFDTRKRGHAGGDSGKKAKHIKYEDGDADETDDTTDVKEESKEATKVGE